MIAFTVHGKPLSQNRAYRRARNGRMFITDEATAWKAQIAHAATLAGIEAGTTAGGLCGIYRGPVAVQLRVVFDSERPDVDGPVKLALDALQGVLFVNDRQVVDLRVLRVIDRAAPRLEVEVRAVVRGAA